MSKNIICGRRDCPRDNSTISAKKLDGVLLVTRPAQSECFECHSFICLEKEEHSPNKVEERKKQREAQIEALAKDIVAGAKKRLHYDPDKDPVIQDFRRKMNDIKNGKY